MKLRMTMLVFGLLSMTVGTWAQTLREKLAGKTTFDEIMEVVDDHYRGGERIDPGDPRLKHWMRWEWYMSGRLGPQGQFVNIPNRIQQALRHMKATDHQTRSLNSGWSFVAPTSSSAFNSSADLNGLARVDRIAFHPSDSNTIYIGTPAGGLWRTTNGGTSWSNVSGYIPSLGISGIVVDYSNTNHLYVLTGDGDSNVGGFVERFGYMRPSAGVLESTDGGQTWNATGTLPGDTVPYVGYRLAQSPSDPNVILAATSIGLFRTSNGGETWSLKLSGRIYDVEFKPGDGSRVYASGNGMYRYSNDGGQSWFGGTFDFPLCAGGRVEIATTPVNDSVVYLVAGPGNFVDTTVFCGLWISTNNGLDFTRQSNSPNILRLIENSGFFPDQSAYDLAFAARTDSLGQLFVGALCIWGSTTSGFLWSQTTSYFQSGPFPYIHPDIHDLAYNPLDDALYAATDGGMFKSSDHGASWTDLSGTIAASQIYHMRGFAGDQDKLMCGLQDNGIKYRNTNSSSFNHIGQGDGFDVVFNPETGEPAYGTGNTYVVKYTSNGSVLQMITPAMDIQYFYKTLAVHNADSSIVLVGTDSIYKSTNSGSSWTNTGGSGSWALTSCPSNNSRFYAAGDITYDAGPGALYRSDDTGNSWQVKSTKPGFPSSVSWTKITDVATSPTNSLKVWATFGGFSDGVKVVRSTNGGENWSNVSGSLPNIPVNCVVIDTSEGVYAGTDIGVFYRGSGMNDWIPWSNGLPPAPVTDLVINDTANLIRAATFGRGVWESDLPDVCDVNLLVTGNLDGSRHYEASLTITSDATIKTGSGNFISFKAGDFVDLTTGFEVRNNSILHVSNGPCGVGGIPPASNQETEGTATSSSSREVQYTPESIELHLPDPDH